MHGANVHDFDFSCNAKTLSLLFQKKIFLFRKSKINALQSFFWRLCHFLSLVESGNGIHCTWIKFHFYRRILLTALRSLTPSLRNSSTVEGIRFNNKPQEERPDASSFDFIGIQSFDDVPGPRGIYALPFIGPLFHVKKFSKWNDEFPLQRHLVVSEIFFFIMVSWVFGKF